VVRAGTPALARDATQHTRGVLFISWIRHHGRSAGLCARLPADCAFVGVGDVGDRRTAPLRYAVQTVRTVLLLITRRPKVLWVMAPPTPLVVLALAYRRIRTCVVVVDAHSNAVINAMTGERRSVRWLRRADLVVVTTKRLAALLERSGVQALPLHDPPLAAATTDNGDSGDVVMPASWFSDEPWQDVLDAARLLPDVTFRLTGRAPAHVTASGVPSNVVLTGYLSAAEFDRLIATAGVVLALTTREDTMQRAAYEAIAAGRPVVASGTTALREHLTRGAVFTTGGGADLADAVRRALDNRDRLAAESASLRAEHAQQFEADLDAVRRAITGRG
jgi:glycosyltransferase involved in cell wall biosynthesis